MLSKYKEVFSRVFFYKIESYYTDRAYQVAFVESQNVFIIVKSQNICNKNQKIVNYWGKIIEVTFSYSVHSSLGKIFFSNDNFRARLILNSLS